MKKRKDVSVAEWLADKLRAIAARQAMPLPGPTPVPARVRAGAPRRGPSKPDITKCPDGVSPLEWNAALQNVASGSAPSTIRAGSDVPSDETMRRLEVSAATVTRQQQEQQRYRNQFAVDPITGRSKVR
jgi:hypothetical protein